MNFPIWMIVMSIGFDNFEIVGAISPSLLKRRPEINLRQTVALRRRMFLFETFVQADK
jgi:hypothetical protein